MHKMENLIKLKDSELNYLIKENEHLNKEIDNTK